MYNSSGMAFYTNILLNYNILFPRFKKNVQAPDLFKILAFCIVITNCLDMAIWHSTYV